MCKISPKTLSREIVIFKKTCACKLTLTKTIFNCKKKSNKFFVSFPCTFFDVNY